LKSVDHCCSVASLCGLNLFRELVVNEFDFQRQLSYPSATSDNVRKEHSFRLQTGAFLLFFNAEL
jgi:hypothetical protein